jgi:PAS domain S-box-containing protein
MHSALLFEKYYHNAEVNSILIMEMDGTVLDVNRAFTKNFGYTNEAIQGQNFQILFTEEDKKNRKPQLELDTVTTTGQATDENYVINSKGLPIWSIGESMLVADIEGKHYIVKDVVNLQAKKQLQLFLMQTEELLERIFETSTEVPMMVLDGSMKVVKANPAFLSLFELPEALPSGSRLSDIPHPFWQQPEIKKEVSSIIIKNQPLKRKEFHMQNSKREIKAIRLDSRIIEGQTSEGRKIFILIEEVSKQHYSN